jgi:hypothetical protein
LREVEILSHLKGGELWALTFSFLSLLLCAKKFFLIHDAWRDAPESSLCFIGGKENPGDSQFFVDLDHLITGL